MILPRLEPRLTGPGASGQFYSILIRAACRLTHPGWLYAIIGAYTWRDWRPHCVCRFRRNQNAPGRQRIKHFSGLGRSDSESALLDVMRGCGPCVRVCPCRLPHAFWLGSFPASPSSSGSGVLRRIPSLPRPQGWSRRGEALALRLAPHRGTESAVSHLTPCAPWLPNSVCS